GARAGAGEDQRTALQTGLDAAARQGRPLFLPPGRYETSTLIMPTNGALTGVPGATTLVTVGPGSLISSRGTSNVRLEGLTLDGSRGAIDDPFGGVVEMRGVNNLTITDCRVLDSPRSALVLEQCRGRVTDNLLSGATEYALYSLDASALTIESNRVADCSNGGILVHGTRPREDGTIVRGNHVERIGSANGGTGQWGNGINVFQSDNVIIDNNRVSDCAFSAIRSNGGSNLQIVGNNCLRSGETAIYSEFVFQGAVISSNVVDGAAHGISIANFDKNGRMAVCSGNLVRNLYSQGPYERDPPGFGTGIWVEADTAVTGNVIERAPLFGLALGWGPFLRDVSANGNVIRECGIGIAVTVVEGSGNAVIANNVISETPRGAIVGFRWSERVTEDLAITGADDWKHLTVRGNG
ncbi:MAG: TIGR03808 family TAT-translocated repetitive protein, partial [Pseudomonadota bacterium]